jgi:hypothetical protein
MPALATIEQLSAAQREAQANFRKNHRALLKNQPAVAALLEQVQLDQQWIFARDGSLTAKHTDGRWWADCSIPMLAGRAMLKTLEPLQAGSCMLAPAHAGLVHAARERMGSSAVLFVAQSDPEIARMILSCHDFSDQIAKHRFWIFSGPDWANQLQSAFDRFPGLAIPTRFIRTTLTTDEAIAPLVAAAQEVFSAVLSDRTQQLASIQSQPPAVNDPRKILVICGSEFHLWDDGPTVLRDQLSALAADDLNLHCFDTDDALCGSPLALLQAARESGSVVSANLCRADCNHLIPTQLPWITWITQPAVPAFESAGPRDALVLADANWKPLARKAGWPENRVRICGWPDRMNQSRSSHWAGSLSLICDTVPIEIPATVKDFSSHRLLWDLIAEELAADPLTVEKVDEYLADRARQLNIEIDAIDRRSFINGLILPAYQQGLARLLIANELPIKLWGHGWPAIPEFSPSSQGPITISEELDHALNASTALIYCWPERCAHPMDATGKPILHRSGQDRHQLLRSARQIQNSTKPAPGPTTADRPLARVILELLNSANPPLFV